MVKKILFALIISFSFLLISCKKNENNDIVTNLNNLINNLPEVSNVTLEWEDDIIKANDEYNKLTEKEKQKINNFSKVEESLNKINELNLKIEEINSLINNLIDLDNIKINNEEEVLKIYNEYNKLSNYDKTLINNYSKVEESLKKINLLKSNVNEINDLINKLPNTNDITIDDSQTIHIIKYLLSNLSFEEINEYINDYNKYEEALNIIEQLFDEIKNLKAVEEIIMDINHLPEYSQLTIDDEEAMNDILDKYNSLSSDYKTKVLNYNKLEEYIELITIMKKYNGLNPYKVLNSISDVATSYTCDKLYDEGSCEIIWESSLDDLYYFENGYGKVSRVYQTHKKQEVEITATIKNNNKVIYELSKKIIVEPVLFDELPDVPVATYFQTSALSSYYSYSTRYKQEKTLFSNKAKEALDIVYYAFGHLDGSGNIKLSDENIVQELIKMKEYNVRNILCLAGVDTAGSKYFTLVTADETLRKNFVNNIMDFVEKYNFDGVDVDWESVDNYPVVAENLNMLIKDLKAEMVKRQDENGTPYLLTVAVPATIDGSATDRFDYKTLNNYVDYYNIMSYALNDVNKSTHLAALYSSSNDNGRGLSANHSVELITSRGADIKKLIIGAAAYGKCYYVTGTSSNSNYPGLGATAQIKYLQGVANAYASGTLFLNAIHSLISTGKYVEYLEYNNKGELVGSYLYNATDKIFVTYDNNEIIEAKYNYAKENGLGIMCWAYTQDTYDDFVNTVYETINNK